MTKVYLDENGNRIIHIEVEEDDVCEECGTIAELRPYGENFKKICFECGMKNPELTQRMSEIVLFGE